MWREASLTSGQDATLPEWLVPYAERAFARFPDLFLALGDPALPQAFRLPFDDQSAEHCESGAEVFESSNQKVVRVTLRQHEVSSLDTQRLRVDPYSSVFGGPVFRPPAVGNGYVFPGVPDISAYSATAMSNAAATNINYSSTSPYSVPAFSIGSGGAINGNMSAAQDPSLVANAKADESHRLAGVGVRAEEPVASHDTLGGLSVLDDICNMLQDFPTHHQLQCTRQEETCAKVTDSEEAYVGLAAHGSVSTPSSARVTAPRDPARTPLHERCNSHEQNVLAPSQIAAGVKSRTRSHASISCSERSGMSFDLSSEEGGHTRTLSMVSSSSNPPSASAPASSKLNWSVERMMERAIGLVEANQQNKAPDVAGPSSIRHSGAGSAESPPAFRELLGKRKKYASAGAAVQDDIVGAAHSCPELCKIDGSLIRQQEVRDRDRSDSPEMFPFKIPFHRQTSDISDRNGRKLSLPRSEHVMLKTTMTERFNSAPSAPTTFQVFSNAGASPILSSSSNSPCSSTSFPALGSPTQRRQSLMSRRGMKLSLPGDGDQAVEPPPGSPSVQSCASATEEPAFAPAASVNSPTRTRTKRNSLRFASGGPQCAFFERNTPAVRLLFERKSNEQPPDGSNPQSRCLPGAFPQRRTVFFFDWDDTLCPTSWIRSHLKDHISDSQMWIAPELQNTQDRDWYHSIPGWFSQPLPDIPQVREMIMDLQTAIINLICRAQAFGVVCIVTNAVDGWVERTIKKWLPRLKPYIFGHGARPEIRVIYGQQAYKDPPSALDDLPWVDECGPYMWWKKAAMTMALDEVDGLYRLSGAGTSSPSTDAPNEVLPSVPWYGHGNCKRIGNVISVGDNDAEMLASELSAIAHEERRIKRLSDPTQTSMAGTSYTVSNASAASQPPWPWIKRVKMQQSPPLKQLITQLEEMVDLLPCFVALRKHFQIDLGGPGEFGERADDVCQTEPRSRAEIMSNIMHCSDSDFMVEYNLHIVTV